MDRVHEIINFLEEHPEYQMEYGCFDCRNTAGDKMETIYNKDGVQIDICYSYGYLEVFGLKHAEFEKLYQYYMDNY